MAVTQVVYKINQAGTWTFQTDATNTFTTPMVVKKGKNVHWQIGSGLTGTFQVQTAPIGSSAFAPTPVNGNVAITNGDISGVYTAGADVLFRVALTAFSSGSCTVEVRK